MFRHSTKQQVRSQSQLRQKAVVALNSDRQILCDSVYTNTYDTKLPSTSADILNNIISPLTGHEAEPSVDSRGIFTVCLMEHDDLTRFRICFLQPEVSSATANTSSAYSQSLFQARIELQSHLNNPAPGRIQASAEKCQIAGRLAPYIVEEAGLSGKVTWSYCNASKSRFVYSMTSHSGAVLLGLTDSTINIYRSFCVKDCAIVYSPGMKCFKVTSSPDAWDQTDTPNKSTCIFLYGDGSFKVVGTPHKAYKVCLRLRETILAAHASSMHRKLIESLVPL